jgi:hypothetical protein
VSLLQGTALPGVHLFPPLQMTVNRNRYIAMLGDKLFCFMDIYGVTRFHPLPSGWDALLYQ